MIAATRTASGSGTLEGARVGGLPYQPLGRGQHPCPNPQRRGQPEWRCVSGRKAEAADHKGPFACRSNTSHSWNSGNLRWVGAAPLARARADLDLPLRDT